MRGYEYEKRVRIERGRGDEMGKRRETNARVLDYLPYGYPDDSRPAYQKKSLVHAVGEDQFVLMNFHQRRIRFPWYTTVYI